MNTGMGIVGVGDGGKNGDCGKRGSRGVGGVWWGVIGEEKKKRRDVM